MINIAICDDENDSCQKIEGYILDYLKINDLEEICIYKYNKGQDLINACHEMEFDLVYMDIELNDFISGVSLASLVQNIHMRCLIIYVSSHDNYYQAMVEHELFTFIHKPIDRNEFLWKLGEAINRIKYIYVFFSFMADDVYVKVKPSDIMYASSSLKKITMTMKDGTIYTFKYKLDKMEKELKKSCAYFMRTHKSFLVNYLLVEKMGTNEYKMKDGAMIPVSKTYREELARQEHNLMKR